MSVELIFRKTGSTQKCPRVQIKRNVGFPHPTLRHLAWPASQISSAYAIAQAFTELIHTEKTFYRRPNFKSAPNNQVNASLLFLICYFLIFLFLIL